MKHSHNLEQYKEDKNKEEKLGKKEVIMHSHY